MLITIGIILVVLLIAGIAFVVALAALDVDGSKPGESKDPQYREDE